MSERDSREAAIIDRELSDFYAIIVGTLAELHGIDPASASRRDPRVVLAEIARIDGMPCGVMEGLGLDGGTEGEPRGGMR